MKTAMLLAAGLLAALTLGAQDKGPAKEETKQVTGQDGKTYIEKKTPFGKARYEKQAEAEKKDEPPANMRAFDEGDTVRFERRTPFGTRKWSKKKTELDEMEKAALEREQASQAKR
jgi:hypothetical protein